MSLQKPDLARRGALLAMSIAKARGPQALRPFEPA